MNEEIKKTSVETIIEEERSSRGLYSQYNTMMGYARSKERNKVRFEKPEVIRRDLSAMSVREGSYKVVNCSPWDKQNYGGVPIDYDPASDSAYVDSSDAHTLIIGATGSKKSRLIAMPTVLSLAAAGESMLICDPKGEIHRRTVGVLKEKGYSIGILNFREPEYSDKWNILSIPYKYYCNGEVDKACEFVNDFAINIIPIYSQDPYWDYSARDLLFGLTLLLFKLCKEGKQYDNKVNIASVLELKQEVFGSTDSSQIRRSAIWRYIEKDHLIKNRLIGTAICPEKTLSCILSTFDQQMSCFSLQPKIINMLSYDTLDLDGLGREKKAVFIIMPDEKTTYHKIVSVFIKESYEYLINSIYQKGIDNRYPVRINYILDEFSSLPKISDFPQMISAARSRNIRFMLVLQSKHQLIERYGEEAQTIQSNCTNWMFLFSRELSLLDEVSNLCGRNKGEPLVSPSLLQHLDKEKGECLLMLARNNPYIARLADIDSYYNFDDSIIYPEKSAEERKADILTSEEIDRIIRPPEPNRDNDHYDIQKELEAKFDELFGNLDDEPADNDDSWSDTDLIIDNVDDKDENEEIDDEDDDGLDIDPELEEQLGEKADTLGKLLESLDKEQRNNMARDMLSKLNEVIDSIKNKNDSNNSEPGIGASDPDNNE